MNAIDKRIIRCDGVRLASANLPDGGKGTMLVCQPDDILEIIGWIEKPLPPLQKKYTTGMWPNHFFAIFALVFT